ncbi:hypothetical protein [Flavobacterium sp. T12S277]|uniref:hypothetical protein n=1 Tax=Flavobacterium sp. T12S277 TaxID=3402752 RepID=UPI003AEB3C9B
MKYKYNYLKSTMIFCVIGFIIPGFTAMLLFGTQFILQRLGVECTTTWKALWVLSWIGMLFLPVLFYKSLKKKETESYDKLKTNLIFFNFLEYIFMQTALSIFFTKANTLCYVSDGQNGIELVFTAWLSLPVLMIFSYIFEYHTETTISSDK